LVNLRAYLIAAWASANSKNGGKRLISVCSQFFDPHFDYPIPKPAPTGMKHDEGFTSRNQDR
jgi:hypothetical protein